MWYKSKNNWHYTCGYYFQEQKIETDKAKLRVIGGRKATPACRNACLREADPTKAGTSACRHGHACAPKRFSAQARAR
jgi:hypothetical protein